MIKIIILHSVIPIIKNFAFLFLDIVSSFEDSNFNNIINIIIIIANISAIIDSVVFIYFLLS